MRVLERTVRERRVVGRRRDMVGVAGGLVRWLLMPKIDGLMLRVEGNHRERIGWQ